MQPFSSSNSDGWDPSVSRSPPSPVRGSPFPYPSPSWLAHGTLTPLNPFSPPSNQYQDYDQPLVNCTLESLSQCPSPNANLIVERNLSIATPISSSLLPSSPSMSSSESSCFSSDGDKGEGMSGSPVESGSSPASGSGSAEPGAGAGAGDDAGDDASTSSSGRPGSAQRYRKSSVRRLAAQMKYDKKRRNVQKVAFDSLRESLNAAHKEWQRVHQQAADVLDEEEQESSMLKEWQELSMQLQEGQKITTLDLFQGASKAISGLRRLKRALEGKVQEMDSSDQVTELLDNIQVVHKKYRAEMDAVRNIETSNQFLPRSLTDVSRIFQDMVVFTMDGTFITAAGPAAAPSPLEDAVDERRILSGVYHLGRFGGRWGSAIIHQMHALVSYCSNGAFLNQLRTQSRPTLPENQRNEISAANVVQMLRDSAGASLRLSSPSSSSSSASYSFSSSASLPVSNTSWPSVPFSASFDDALVRHPLGSLSCPASALYTYFQIVSSWIALGPDGYVEQMDALLALAKAASTDDYANSKVVWQEEFHAKGYTPKDMVFHPLTAAPFEWIPALFGLLSGQKSVITIPCFSRLKHGVVPNEMTIFCVKEPNTGMPLALVYLLHSIRADKPANFLHEESAALERVRKNVSTYYAKQSRMRVFDSQETSQLL